MGLGKEEKSNFKNKIRELIQETELKIEELEELSKPVAPENSIGRLTRMDAINSGGVAKATLRAAREKLAKLTFALSKVDSSDFGICSVCNNPIPEKRLLFMPESTRCVHCADR